jgi:hypothetical protein
LARSTRFLGRIWISYVFGRLSRVFLSIVVSLMYRLPSSRRMRSTRLVIIDSQLLQHHHSLGDPTSTHILRSQYQTPHICIITIASARMHAAVLAVGKHFVVSDGRTVWDSCQQLAPTSVRLITPRKAVGHRITPGAGHASLLSTRPSGLSTNVSRVIF